MQWGGYTLQYFPTALQKYDWPTLNVTDGRLIHSNYKFLSKPLVQMAGHFTQAVPGELKQAPFGNIETWTHNANHLVDMNYRLEVKHKVFFKSTPRPQS